jgi:endonuclease-3 related protein
MRAARRGPIDFHEVYRRLAARRGPAGWWPAQSAFEVCVGAILVQNTAWTNVEKALGVLRSRELLSFEALRDLPAAEIAPLIRSSGCFNVKARRLRALLDFLGQEYGGRVEAMETEDPARLRARLLAVPGVGRETADSIALYAAGQRLFVIDAYTRRVFARLGVVKGDEPYDVLQRRFMDALPPEAGLYNDFHAQIVLLAKDVCTRRPACAACPLEEGCPRVGVAKPLAPQTLKWSRMRAKDNQSGSRRRPSGTSSESGPTVYRTRGRPAVSARRMTSATVSALGALGSDSRTTRSQRRRRSA